MYKNKRAFTELHISLKKLGFTKEVLTFARLATFRNSSVLFDLLNYIRRKILKELGLRHQIEL